MICEVSKGTVNGPFIRWGFELKHREHLLIGSEYGSFWVSDCQSCYNKLRPRVYMVSDWPSRCVFPSIWSCDSTSQKVRCVEESVNSGGTEPKTCEHDLLDNFTATTINQVKFLVHTSMFSWQTPSFFTLNSSCMLVFWLDWGLTDRSVVSLV